MAIFVHILQQCRDDAARHGCMPDLDKFAEYIRNEQRLSRFDLDFPPPYMVKKKFFVFNRRLIAVQRQVGEHTVVCFARILIRGEAAYEKGFGIDPEGWGDKHILPLIDEAQLVELVRQEEQQLVRVRRVPNEEEATYLYEVLQNDKYDWFICESPTWRQNMLSDKKLQNQLPRYYDVVLSLVDSKGADGNVYAHKDKPEVKVLYRVIPGLKRIYLAAPITRESDIEMLASQHAQILQAAPEALTEQLILQNSVRSYPEDVLLEEEMWYGIQKDADANMALSPEEMEILESVSKGGTGYPLFINGRAGSGKSTLLQYLFAEYFHHYVRRNGEQSLAPRYLTCSRELLDISKRKIKDIVKSHYSKLLESGAATPAAADKQQLYFDDAFQEFHEYLYGLLPRTIAATEFGRANYVDYARFKRLWVEKFGKQPGAQEKYGFDISWHVVRSYIKGMSGDDYLEPEEYAAIPVKQRSVTNDAFKNVYDKVWPWYSSLCEEHKYWDDQDLARKILELDLVKPGSPAIFCDEAQDFTRVELELLFRLNLFSDRFLYQHEISRVPFVFAGDQFQTLNPTGFRWDAIKAAFVSKFIHAFESASRSGTEELNYRELSFNYRSSRNIVNLCNTIQALRSVLFNLKNVLPQRSWSDDESASLPVFFDASDANIREQLREQIDITIIVPCADGEERDYVSKDELLRAVVQVDEAGFPQNVFSPARVKGLEYSRVLLYGFGKECVGLGLDVTQYLKSREVLTEDRDQALPYEYFMNKLYVAASRPKQKLFIVDTSAGREKLWLPFLDGDVRQLILDGMKDRVQWEPLVGGLAEGAAIDWTGESRDKSEDLAKKYEKEGVVQRDPAFLRSAALYYKSVNNLLKDKECRARALDIEGSHIAAGDLLLQCELHKDAMDSYWRAGDVGYDGMLEVVRLRPELKGELEFQMAAAVKKQGTEAGAILAIFRELQTSGRIIQGGIWLSHAQMLVGRLVRNKALDGRQEVASRMLALVVELSAFGLKVSEADLAYLHYAKEDYERAAELWEKAGEKNSDKYLHAKARSLPYPKSLEYLQKIGERHEIVNAYEQNSGMRLGREDEKTVTGALIASGKLDMAHALIMNSPNQPGISELLQAAVVAGQTGLAQKAIGDLLKAMIADARWLDAIDLAERGVLEGVQNTGPGKTVKRYLSERRPELRAKLINLFAKSKVLESADPKEQKLVSDFLKSYLITPEIKWIDSLSPVIAGTAMERAGRIIDCIELYERLEASGRVSEDVKSFAAGRWIKCKLKMKDLDEKRAGNKPTSTSKRHLNDAMSKARDLGIDTNTLSEYPDADDVLQNVTSKPTEPAIPESAALGIAKASPMPSAGKDVSVTPADLQMPSERVIVKIQDQFDVTLNRKYRKLVITNIETSDVLQFNIDAPDLSKSPVLVQFSDNDRGLVQCSSWGLQVDLRKVASEKTVTIVSARHGVRIPMEL